MNNLTDMARTPEEAEKYASPLMMDTSKYPWGLRISLTKEDLEKMGVEHGDWDIGDVFALDVLAKVVSKSSNESENGEDNCCVSLQITHIGSEEDEDELEDEEEEEDEEPLKRHGYERINYGK